MGDSLIEDFLELWTGVGFEDESLVTDSREDFLGECFREVDGI